MMVKIEKPDEYKRLIELWGLIKECNPGLDLYEGDLVYEEGKLLSGEWAWPLNVVDVSTDELNRCGDILNGPLFSSAKHPWPYCDNQPMMPGVQLDLEKASNISGNIFGGDPDRVIQLWASPSDAIIDKPYFRLIPKADVIPSEITPIPEFAFPDHLFMNTWLTENTSKQIVGYRKKPKFTMQPIEPIRGKKSIPELKNYSELCFLIDEFNKLLKKFSNKWDPAGTHLFGTFYPIQYYSFNVPPPLLCLDGDYGFMWGDNGTAQLCYSANGESLEFEFMWSCF